MRKNFYLFLFSVGIISSIITTLNAQTWLNNWDYRREITITNNSDSTLTDLQVKIDLSSLTSEFDFGNAKSDGSDIRITTDNGTTLLPFWIETWNSTSKFAVIWTKIPNLPIGVTTIYLYYGNMNAENISEGFNTFHTYDGFENYTLGSVPNFNAVNPGEWNRYQGNPVLIPGPTGSWDALGATFASVIYDDQVNEYRMYYHGYNSSYHQVGLATSPDGLNWTKYPENPIVTVGSAGSWDRTGVRVPMVWKEGPNDYRMIYTGSGSAAGQIGYATSSDGINWTKYSGNPVFNDPTWAHNQTENWGVIKVENEYLMWYSTWGNRQSGIAVSTDLINWTPHTTDPIFATNGIPSDDRYSQFCPFSFKYNNEYYVLVPSYSSVGDYSKFYLYRSSSPYFPENDRTLVRVAHTPQGVDAKDNDTPFVLTLDIERSIFPNNELRVYYGADPGTGGWAWSECLLIEPDIAEALSNKSLPTNGNLSWTSHTSNNTLIAVVNNPIRSGTQSVKFTDNNTNGSVSLTGTFAQLTQGVVGSWMQRSSNNLANDFDIYLYDTNNILRCVAGLGRDGYFHYWTGSFTSTAVPYSLNTWYLVTLVFNSTNNNYDFVVYNESMQEIVRVNNIAFGNSGNSTAINRGMLYCGGTFEGNAFADDFRVLKHVSAEPDITIGEEKSNPVPVELNSFSAIVIGSTIKLNWITETEINNYGFEIERQVSNIQSPTSSYKVIGFVNGSGNSNSPKYYYFEDKYLSSGKYYYRLKQIDNDGKYEYSKTIEVNLGSPVKYELSQNYPNPFNPSTTIKFSIPEANHVKLVIYNLLGEQVAELLNEIKEAGVHTINFDASNLNSGMYLYKLVSGSFIQTRKMIVIK